MISPGRRWLSLKISETGVLKVPNLRPVISIPKKIVRLATRRNRLRRLIREASRGDDFFGQTGQGFYFKVIENPGDVGCAEVKVLIAELKKEWKQNEK